MKHIQKEQLEKIITVLGERFDSHALERQLLKLYPREFALELLEFTKKYPLPTQYPLQEFSSQFAIWFGKTFADEVLKTKGKVTSANLVGNQNKNQGWQLISLASQQRRGTV